MDNASKILIENWHAFLSYAPRFVIAIIILAISYLAGKYLSNLVLLLLRRTPLQLIHEPFFRVTTTSIALFIGVIVALNVLGLEKLAISVLAGGGVTAIIIGFAFREIGENFLAGLFLAFSRPFNIGDVIRTEEFEGKVKDIELRYTHLRTDDDKDVYVPSSQLFNKAVTNFTKIGRLRISFSVGIDYTNDAKRACTLLHDTTQQIQGVMKDPEPNAYILSLTPQYVDILVFFWVDMHDTSINILNIRTDVMDKCRQALLDGKFTISSDTTTNIAIVNREAAD